jgi:hypothetical protein
MVYPASRPSSLHSQFEDRHDEIRGMGDIAYRHAVWQVGARLAGALAPITASVIEIDVSA